MKKITFKTLILLAVMLSLAACQPLSNLPAFFSGANGPQPGPLPLTGEHASQLGASALMIEEIPGQSGSQLVPVLADTGKPIAHFTPIDFGRNAQYGLSPSREHLAYVSFSTPDCIMECLYLLNLRTWQQEFKPLKVNEGEGTWISNLAFNSAGTRLALALNSQTETTSTLLLVDLTDGKLLQQVVLETNVYHLGIAPDSSIVVEGTSGLRQDKSIVARVMTLDGVSLAVKWQQDLDDVLISNESTFNSQDPSAGVYFDPAVAFSPDNSKLYIAAADTPNLIRVDFGSRSINRVLIQKPMGWIERLLTVGAGVAYGKYLNSTTKSGVISTDGKSFYITGQTSKAVKDKDGNWTQESTPLGMQVVDSSSGTQTGALQNDATMLSLSVDGKTILLNGWKSLSDGSSLDWTDLVDASTLKISGHIESQVRSSRLLDGSLVYLASHYRVDGSSDMAIYRAGSQTLLSQWNEPSSGYADWVIIP